MQLFFCHCAKYLRDNKVDFIKKDALSVEDILVKLISHILI